MIEKDAVLKPLQVRFTEPEDIERYGADWYTYSELDIVTMTARQLMPIEQEIGAPIVQAMDGVRKSTAFGDTVGAWLALRMAGKMIPFAQFDPRPMLLDWRTKPDDEGKDSGASTPAPESPAMDSGGTSPDRSTGSRPATVVLPIMPAAESST